MRTRFVGGDLLTVHFNSSVSIRHCLRVGAEWVHLDFKRETCLFAKDVESLMRLADWWRLLFFLRRRRQEACRGNELLACVSAFLCISVHVSATASQNEGWNVLIVYHQVVFSEEGFGWLLKLQPLTVCAGRTALCLDLGPSTTLCYQVCLYLLYNFKDMPVCRIIFLSILCVYQLFKRIVHIFWKNIIIPFCAERWMYNKYEGPASSW